MYNKSKAKGSAFERTVARLMTNATNRFFWRSGGSGTVTPGDLTLVDDIPFVVETKAYKAIDFYREVFSRKHGLFKRWAIQLENQRVPGRVRLLFLKSNRNPIIVGIALNDLERHLWDLFSDCAHIDVHLPEIDFRFRFLNSESFFEKMSDLIRLLLDLKNGLE